MRTEIRHGTGKRLLLSVFLLLGLTVVFFLTRGEKRETAAPQNTSATLVIDAGHGGIDCGALGHDGTRESDLNLAIALKLRALAELYGQDNLMIRQDDSTKSDTEAYSEHRDLECRTELTNTARNPVYISIHQNTYPTGQPSGPQVIYAVAEGSRELGTMLQANLLRSLYPDCRRVAEPVTKRLYVLSHVNCPAVLVECGFMSNMIDLQRLKDSSFQVGLAAVLMGSFLQYRANTERI
ncbi:MAG: N-acetylmuramoyl-L-alanine amidase [Eubacteriales bacterium]|nr:N-acetylmuramoyl-L-alanine amidase [Eubacteriales bacterium]